MSKFGLDLIRKIKPISWVFDEEKCRERSIEDVIFKKTHLGVSAQQLEGLLPANEFAAVIIDEEDNYRVNYYQLIGPLISAVKELSERIEELEKK